MSTALTQIKVAEAIHRTRSQYLARRFARPRVPMCLFEINNGLSDAFADDVVTALGRHPCFMSQADGLLVIEGNHFRTVNADGDEVWDARALARHWGIQAPSGMTWEQVNTLEFGNHFWLAARVGAAKTWLHFDAECDQGVATFFELPLYRRYLTRQWPTPEQVWAASPLQVF